jgi:hypothetical protein
MAVEQVCLLASRVASHVQKYYAKGYSRTVRLYPLASRAASQLQKDDAKGYSLTVKLYLLASREMSHADYRSLQAYCFTLLGGESSPCHLFPRFLTPTIFKIIVVWANGLPHLMIMFDHGATWVFDAGREDTRKIDARRLSAACQERALDWKFSELFARHI